jgi:Fe-S cluster biogenesis protein NfuA
VTAELDGAIKRVNRRLDAHAGAIRVERVDHAGVAHVRFMGMCTGCPAKPVTLSAVVVPELERIDGVTGVEAAGARVSPAAAARLAALRERAIGGRR